MSTPRSKPIVRFPTPRKRRLPQSEGFWGAYRAGITSPEFQSVLGDIVSRWVHLEELMIRFMALLLGNTERPPARQIFRSVANNRARIEIMRSLLEESPSNKDKGPEYDAIISEFEAIGKERNKYVHGLWWTDLTSGQVGRVDAADTSEGGGSLQAVSLKSAKHIPVRMSALRDRINAVMPRPPRPSKRPP